MEIPLSILQALIYELNHFIWSEVSPAGNKRHQQEARHLPGGQAGATAQPSWEDKAAPGSTHPRDHPEHLHTQYQTPALRQAQVTPRFRKALGNWVPFLPEQRNALFARASHQGTQFPAARQGQAQGSAPTTAHFGGAPERSTDLMRGPYHRGDDIKGRDQTMSFLQNHPPPLPAQIPILWSGTPYVDISFPLTGKGFSQMVEHSCSAHAELSAQSKRW